MAPALLASYLKDSHGIIGAAWWVNTILTVMAFVTACVVVSQADDVDDGLNAYNNYNNNNNNYEGNNNEYNNQQYQQNQWNPTSLTSGSLQFASLYLAIIAGLMCVFGIFAVKKDGLSQLGVGIFIGCLILFANFTLICAIIFAEVWVTGELPDEYRRQREEAGYSTSGHYKVENSSHAFAGMCFFISALNAAFAIIVIVYHDKMRDQSSNGASTGDFDRKKNENDADYVQYE